MQLKHQHISETLECRVTAKLPLLAYYVTDVIWQSLGKNLIFLIAIV